MDFNSVSNISNSSVCLDPTTPETNIVIAVIVGFFLVVSLVEDVVTLLVIAKNKSLHTSTNYFLFSLCISDLISGLICSPLWVYRRTWGFCRWKLGRGLCTLYWTADFGTNYVTSMHILSFALFRSFAVHWPFRMSLLTKRRILVYICVLWAVAVPTALPLYWVTGVIDQRGLQLNGAHWPSCSLCDEENITTTCLSIYQTYMVFITATFFYVPLISVILVSCCTARAVLRKRRWRRSNSSACNLSSRAIAERHQSTFIRNPDAAPENCRKMKNISKGFNNTSQTDLPRIHAGRNHVATNLSVQSRQSNGVVQRSHKSQSERNIFTQLILVVVAFMIGYVPIAIYQLWTIESEQHPAIGKTDYWFGVVAYLCLRLSECMNPIMYNLGSSKIRNATKKLLKFKK